MKKHILLISLFFALSGVGKGNYPTPKLTTVIVIDQLAHHYFMHHKSYFSQGFKTFLEKGIVYENTYHPHGIPVTAAGHATLSTGAYPKHHGFTLNSWVSPTGEKQKCTNDDDPNARTFTADGINERYGESARYLMVPTVSDVFSNEPNHTVYSLSYKPRAAIGLGGKKGKAIWFDEQEQMFTTSKAYFPALPSWLQKFNKKHDLKNLDHVAWQPFHPPHHPIYQKLIDRTAPMKDHPFILTPTANSILLNLAKTCIAENLPKTKGNFLLWVSLSSLDKIGHRYGPNSIYPVDMLCHLDAQIQDFINFIHTLLPQENTAFILTSDHGVAPFPEDMHELGLTNSKRISVDSLTEKLNTIAQQEFSLSENIIAHFKTSTFFINHNACKNLSNYKKSKLLTRLKQTIMKEKGIAKVWTLQDLKKKNFLSPIGHAHLYKKQLFPGRLGELICMPEPYCYLSSKNHGTSHRSPYEYDTHIPLMVYHPSKLKPSTVMTRVCTTQLAPTLAKMLDILPPPTCVSSPLPGI